MLFPVSGVGNLTANAEISYQNETSKLVKMTVAASERVKNENGEWEDRPSFYSIKLWMPKASTLDTYLVKGQSVFVTGVLFQERWEKDNKKQSMLVVDCSAPGHGVSLVGPKKDGTAKPHTEDAPKEKAVKAPVSEKDLTNDEIPF